MGLAQMQFEALYRRLEAEGLFDPARKRPLPTYPRRIGVVTSDGGAVIHDLLVVLGRRYPIGEVVFARSSVQGAAAIPELVAAIGTLANLHQVDGLGVDLIVVARGGGSAEDLAAFNDERVVRAIFGSRVPVVSAIGHESDVTLADLVADLRAPTPSAAAEMIAPDLAALCREVVSLQGYAYQTLATHLAATRQEVGLSVASLQTRMKACLQQTRASVATQSLHLDTLSPAATLRRGYAIVQGPSGVLRDAAETTPGEALQIRLQRGSLDAAVTATRLAPTS